MRLDAALDVFYVVSALWGGRPGRHVCAVTPAAGTRAAVTPRLSAGVTAFVDVNVIPMDIERVLQSQTVLIENGRITALGPAGQVLVPAGATRIDGRGKYLIPGLTDMHVHGPRPLTASEFAPFLASQVLGGVTAIRYLSDVDTSGMQKLRRPNAGNEHLFPYAYLSGKVSNFMRPGVSTDSAAAAFKAEGYNFVFTYTPVGFEQPTDSLFFAAARRLGLPAGSHLHGASVEELGAYGGSIEHLYSFVRKRSWGSIKRGTTLSTEEIQALVTGAQRAGVWITPTIACYEYSSIDVRVVEFQRQMVSALHKAGVGLLLGAEGGYVADELAGLVRSGLTPYEALVTGTVNPARYFGISKEHGMVAVGKRADLVLLSGNPLTNIEYVREPVGVMLDGHWLDRVTLDQKLLAFPGAWFRRTWVSGYDDDPELTVPVQNFEALTDSLKSAPPTKVEGFVRHLVDILAALRRELGERRISRNAEMQKNFDVIARAWMREQARQGRQIPVPGVAQAP